ncbi:hypothetical protein Ancab_009837 [Ancistrocladus abbreviatus]
MPERRNSWMKPKVHSIDLVPKLQEVLGSKVTEKCLVRPIEGCKVLLSPERGYNLKDFIESECVPWRKWFSVIQSWIKTDVGIERATWVNCYPIPLHLWNFDFFIALATRWGRIVLIDLSIALKERFDITWILISTPCYEVIKEDIRVAVEEDTFLISVMDGTGGDGWESNSLKKASNQFSLVMDWGICSTPLEVVSSYNNAIELPANGKSGSLNRVLVPELGSCDIHDDFVTQKKASFWRMGIHWRIDMVQGRSHTDNSIANGLINPAHLDNIGDRTTITSLGPSEDLINQGPVHSLEQQANRTHSNGWMIVAYVNQCSGDETRSMQKAPKDLENTGYVETNRLVRRKKSLNTLLKSLTAALRGKKTSRKVKKKTIALTKEDPVSVLEGIDFSVASTTDSQIANVSKRVAEMREERNTEKIRDFLIQSSIINETEVEFLVDKIKELEKNEVRLGQHVER